MEVGARCPLVLRSLGSSAHPLEVDDLEVEEASADELEHSRLAHSSILAASW
jgi:hypothetical protein